LGAKNGIEGYEKTQQFAQKRSIHINIGVVAEQISTIKKKPQVLH
jgi:hypothetical protein